MKYSGTHTVLGELVGRVIGTAVTAGLARYMRWHGRRTPHHRAKNL
jgi:adenosylcobinamide amidohydrolase